MAQENVVPVREVLREVAPQRDAEATVEMAFERAHGPWIVEVGAATGARSRVVREGERLVLGSAVGSDLQVVDPAVSGRHCSLLLERGLMIVEDLGSKNGIFVGGGLVPRASLGAGASFVVGRAVVTCDPARGADGAADE